MQSLGIINFWEFFIATVILIISPGPNSIFVFMSSVQSRMIGFYAMLGVIIGDLFYLILSAVGVSAFLKAVPELWTFLIVAGIVFLIYLGVQLMISDHSHFFSTQQNSKHHYKPKEAFLKSIFICLGNVKSLGFAVMFFPLFIDKSFSPSYVPIALLLIITSLCTFVWLNIVIIIGQMINKQSRKAASSMNNKDIKTLSRFMNMLFKSFGGLFILFAIAIAREEFKF